MNKMRQKEAPLYAAMEHFRRLRVVPFDVPGHKRGRGNPQLVDFLGQQCVEVDVNSMKPLDNLCHPVSVIREAELLGMPPYEDEDRHCPVCGEDCETIYVDQNGEPAGCEQCMTLWESYEWNDRNK